MADPTVRLRVCDGGLVPDEIEVNGTEISERGGTEK